MKSLSFQSRPQLSRHAGRAFTLVELLFSILIIGVLAGILIVGLRSATAGARSAADTQTASALKLGIENFSQQFGIAPPLVKDKGAGTSTNPITTTGAILYCDPQNATDATFLRNNPAAASDLRYSVHSLAYYLVGSLDQASDGWDGPGMRSVSRDGAFKLSDRAKFEPFIDAGKGSFRVYFSGTAVSKDGRVEIRDRNETPIRYYRWLDGVAYPDSPGSFLVRKPEDLNVPSMVGDPKTDPTLRDSTWAVVMAGANKLFGDEPIAEIRQALASNPGDSDEKVRAEAKKDNIVEVGR